LSIGLLASKILLYWLALPYTAKEMALSVSPFHRDEPGRLGNRPGQ
jgi:hypothetical protein